MTIPVTIIGVFCTFLLVDCSRGDDLEAKGGDQTLRSEPQDQTTKGWVHQQPTAIASIQQEDTLSEKRDPVSILRRIARETLTMGDLFEITFVNRLAKFKFDSMTDDSEQATFLEQLCKSDVAFRAVELNFYTDGYDEFGNESKTLALQMTYKASTLRKVNWENKDQVDFNAIVDDWWPQLGEGPAHE